MLFKKKFDLIISIGEDCACSSYLRRFDLQNYSYPFDWLTYAPFENRVELLCNNFERFLEIDDLKFLPKEDSKTTDKNCDYYENTYNKFYFYHDFKAGLAFEEAFFEVKEKYKRRIKRMYDNINSSKNVLFVWWTRDKHLSDDVYENAGKNLQNKFSNQNVCLLILEYKDIKKAEYNYINENLLKISYDNISYLHNRHWGEVMGNEKNNNKIFSQIKKQRTPKETVKKIQYEIKLLLIKFIPFKNRRHSIRTKIVREHSHAAL